MEEEFKFLPDTIKEDLKRICVYMAEKLNCTFLVGFDDNGDVYFETIKHEGDFDFDEIGAELEIKRLQKEDVYKRQVLCFIIYYFNAHIRNKQDHDDK